MCLLSALPPELALELLEAVPQSPTYRGNRNAVPYPASMDGSIPRASLSSNPSCCAQPRRRHQEHRVGLFHIKWDFVCID